MAPCQSRRTPAFASDIALYKITTTASGRVTAVLYRLASECQRAFSFCPYSKPPCAATRNIGSRAAQSPCLPRRPPDKDGEMSDSNDHKRQVQTQFGDTAANYVTSPGHARGDDLADLAAWAAPLGGDDRLALDIATGGGHTARAIAAHYGRVVASDLTY